jgi:mercuric ion transport protein
MGGKQTSKAATGGNEDKPGEQTVKVSDRALAAVGATSGFGGLFAAAACCVLPLALASVGVGASGLAALSPLHAPLSVLALVAVAAGWYLYVRRRRACAADATCVPPSRSTPIMLTFATVFVILSGIWPFMEAPMMRVFE